MHQTQSKCIYTDTHTHTQPGIPFIGIPESFLPSSSKNHIHQAEINHAIWNNIKL